jgi:hypothetical protein
VPGRQDASRPSSRSNPESARCLKRGFGLMLLGRRAGEVAEGADVRAVQLCARSHPFLAGGRHIEVAAVGRLCDRAKVSATIPCVTIAFAPDRLPQDRRCPARRLRRVNRIERQRDQQRERSGLLRADPTELIPHRSSSPSSLRR